jgi:hypothetical protein
MATKKESFSGQQHSLQGGGMKRENPKFPDSSMTPPSRSVNGDATRSGAAKTPPSLGPRKLG